MFTDLAVRTGHRLDPDPRRVITRLFVPGEETARGRSRASAVVTRLLALPEPEVVELAAAVVAGFDGRHRDLAGTLAAHFAVVAADIPDGEVLTDARRTLIGATFTHEYSTEAAALFNAAMVAHPDQSGLASGQLRFVMSVRCVGEGHISSIGFRTGVLGPDNKLQLDEPGRFLVTGEHSPGTFQRRLFLSRLADLGDDRENAELLLAGLPETFGADELGEALAAVHDHTLGRERVRGTIEHVHQIASASYDVEFPDGDDLASRLLWPAAPAECNGMEDARLVRFVEPDGTAVYYATYTAYDGAAVRTHLLSTVDFRRFQVTPMAGQGAKNKGLALFPRRIGGRYFALSRWDRESLALVDSDDCRVWESPVDLHVPTQGWELIQTGNGGSPIETERGWLVLTHGVGPMRVYGLGAMLLDLDDPSVVLAKLPGPLLTPAEDERDGYVPNVVYTCGALLNDGVLTIPYGISDGAIGFAQIELARLLDRLAENPVAA